MIIGSESEDDEDMPLTDESDSDDETAGPVVDDDEFEVFKVLEGVVDACCCRSLGQCGVSLRAWRVLCLSSVSE